MSNIIHVLNGDALDLNVVRDEFWVVRNDFFEKIKGFNFNKSTKFKYLQLAINQHLERFPHENGLSQIENKILNERIDAQKNYEISSTPTIYINKKKYEGQHEYKNFKKELEKFF